MRMTIARSAAVRKRRPLQRVPVRMIFACNGWSGVIHGRRRVHGELDSNAEFARDSKKVRRQVARIDLNVFQLDREIEGRPRHAGESDRSADRFGIRLEKSDRVDNLLRKVIKAGLTDVHVNGRLLERTSAMQAARSSFSIDAICGQRQPV
jgi:hypothetical protein